MIKKPIEGSDYCVRVLNFPDAAIGGTVVEDADGFNNVYINARRSVEAQRESFLHELRHIARDDFHNGLPIEEVEDARHESPALFAALDYDTTEEYAQSVEERLGIRITLADDATIQEVAETVAWLESIRDPWRATD